MHEEYPIYIYCDGRDIAKCFFPLLTDAHNHSIHSLNVLNACSCCL